MTISNGSTIDKADLDALLTTGMANLQNYRLRLPRGYNVTLQFVEILSTTTAERRTKSFVVPRDCYIETVAVQCSEVNAPVTVRVTGNGSMYNWPITITGNPGAGIFHLTRTLYDNTPTKNGDRGFRLVNQGSSLTVSVESGKVAGFNVITVAVVFRQFLGR